MTYTCNGSPSGCERERFGGCAYCDNLTQKIADAIVAAEKAICEQKFLDLWNEWNAKGFVTVNDRRRELLHGVFQLGFIEGARVK